MDSDQKKYIKNNILPNFIDINYTLRIGEYIRIYPDMNALFFELDGNDFVLFFADFIDNELDFVTDELKKIKIKVNRYIPLKEDQNSYVYVGSKKTTPCSYEFVYGDAYVCGRL